MTSHADELLDRARAAKEVAIVAALVLIASDGDPADAIARLDGLPESVAAQDDELDAALIAQQAIREAMTIRETGVLPDA
jgi:hypothetical protein